MLRAIIIEQDNFAIQEITCVLEKYFPEITVTGVFHTLVESKLALSQHEFDLLFLGIQLSDGNGFELIENSEEFKFKIIFIADADNDALKAIRVSAVDYLIKPLVKTELIAAVKKVKQFNVHFNERLEMQSILEKFHRKGRVRQLAIPSQNGYSFIDPARIVYLKADGAYTQLFLDQGETFLVSHNLKYFENILQDLTFFRVHHSHIVNLSFISKYVKGTGGYLVMHNGVLIDVASRRKVELLHLLGLDSN